MKKQNTRRALLMSALSILLCVSMLVGTTFAWFTDEVKSGKNQIVAGNLDIELEYKKVVNGVATDWAPVAGKADIFDPNALWEPGRVEVVYLKVSNLGTLALKYQLGVNVYNEITGLTEDDKVIKLSDHLVFKVVEMPDALTTYTDREAVKLAAGTEKGLKDYNGQTTALDPKSDDPAANDEDYLALIVYMPETVGNEANYRGTAVPTIELGINLLATQYTHEEDSWGKEYDEGAKIAKSASTLKEALTELSAGNNVLLNDTIVIDAKAIADIAEHRASLYTTRNTTVIDTNAVIDGYGGTIYRTPDMVGKPIFEVKSGYTLTLSNLTVDGGAKWEGEVDATLLRPTTNTGLVATATVINAETNAHIVLNEGAVIQNNHSSSATISLATRGNGTLTLNGGQILNNTCTNGAVVWLGGATIMNDGIIKGSQGSLGGVFRSVDSQGRFNVSVTMNGGSITNNSAPSGGVIWSGNSLTVRFNGGEVAYNHATSAGGVIWGGSSDKYYITGDFEMHDNTAGELGNAIRFNHYKYPSLEMTGGKVYNNTSAATPYAFYCINDTVALLGGEITDDILYTGGVGLTMGNVTMNGKIHYELSTNHKTAYLAENFSAFEFTVADDAAHYANFNFKPAEGYIYTAGDEAKLVCLNEGYETYWNAEKAVFCLRPIGA